MINETPADTARLAALERAGADRKQALTALGDATAAVARATAVLKSKRADLTAAEKNAQGATVDNAVELEHLRRDAAAVVAAAERAVTAAKAEQAKASAAVRKADENIRGAKTSSHRDRMASLIAEINAHREAERRAAFLIYAGMALLSGDAQQAALAALDGAPSRPTTANISPMPGAIIDINTPICGTDELPRAEAYWRRCDAELDRIADGSDQERPA